MDLDEAGRRLFGGEANAGVAFQIGQLRYVILLNMYVHVTWMYVTCTYMVYTITYMFIACTYMFNTCTHCWLLFVGRVGDGTVPLAIVLYIEGSFVKHKIPVRPIYITVCNLNSVVSAVRTRITL